MSGIKIVWILLLSSEFKSHVFSLPNLLLISPQECLIHFQLHLDNIEVSAVLWDFHSPVLCVLSQTRRLFQSLVIRCIGVAGETDCTNTDTANSSVHPWIPRTDRACTSASGKYSVKNRPCFATLTLLGIVADLVSQFGEIVWQRLFNIARILQTTALNTFPASSWQYGG